MLLHDPELLLAVPAPAAVPHGLGRPRGHRRGARRQGLAARAAARARCAFAVRRLERRAERRLKLLLAEEGYRKRFRQRAPGRAEHHARPGRPARTAGRRPRRLRRPALLARGRRRPDRAGPAAAPDGITLDLIGAADADVRPLLRDAQRDGILRWYGFVPNDRALRMAEGALAGLALLHDSPNYRHSMPTKVVEYMARGLPVITTPNPIAAEIVTEAACGLVVPFQDPQATAAAVRRLRDDAPLRLDMGKRGHEAARARYHWPEQARLFVAQLESWARP